jgi:hypothetical protein
VLTDFTATEDPASWTAGICIMPYDATPFCTPVVVVETSWRILVGENPVASGALFEEDLCSKLAPSRIPNLLGISVRLEAEIELNGKDKDPEPPFTAADPTVEDMEENGARALLELGGKEADAEALPFEANVDLTDIEENGVGALLELGGKAEVV